MPLTLSEMCRNIAPSVTLAIDAKAKAMKASGVDVVGLGGGEPDFPTPEPICEAAIRAIKSGQTRYTPSSGIQQLRQAVVDKLLRDNGLSYKPEQITISNGAKHSLLNSLLAIINPGDEVIIPTPCWVSYPEMVRMTGGKPIFVQMPLGANGEYSLPAQTIRQAVTDKTKAIILNSPQNPTGMVICKEELEDIAQVAVERGFYVISDEIYEKLIYDGCRHVSIAGLGKRIFDQTIVVGGVSKSYAMTGWRIGFAAAPMPIAKLMGNYQSHSTSNPNSIAQWASVVAFEQCEDTITAMRDAFDKRRKTMVSGIKAIPGLSCSEPRGAFYVMMNIGGLFGKSYEGTVIQDAMTFAALLLEHAQVAVVPGEAFEAPDMCRLSYACSDEEILKGLTRIRGFVEALS